MTSAHDGTDHASAIERSGFLSAAAARSDVGQREACFGSEDEDEDEGEHEAR